VVATPGRSGGFTLNGGCAVLGLVLARTVMVIVNGNSTLVGTSASDQFTLNAAAWSVGEVRPPKRISHRQRATKHYAGGNSSTNITLTGSDPQGRTLTFSLLTLPAHGTQAARHPV